MRSVPTRSRRAFLGAAGASVGLAGLAIGAEQEPARASSAPVGVATAPKPDVDEHLEAKLDQVLEKVARYGQDSLTDSERQILFRASEVYKRKRS